jgi:lipopolysaccharide transport system permease protein
LQTRTISPDAYSTVITASTVAPLAFDRDRAKSGSIAQLWSYRELLYFFAWRDIKVRYRQALLGASWAVIQPLLNMIVFAGIFGKFAHIPSNGVPYPLFSYCALLPWTYFSVVIGLASNSLTNNQSLLTKVYFPRVLLPAGTVLAGLLDFSVAALLLVGMMIYYHVKVTWLLLLTPLAVLLMVVLTLGVSMFLAAATVRYRDVKYLLPFVIQILLFATPIIYPVTMIPQRIRPILALNPCWGMVESFRACLLPNQTVDFNLIGVSIGLSVVVFAGSLLYFRKSEKSFADII